MQPHSQAARIEPRLRDSTLVHRPRILLVIELSRIYGRRCLQGIAAYGKTHGPWTFLHVEREPTEKLPSDLKLLRPDAVIARVENVAMGKALQELKVPTVDLYGKLQLPNMVNITTDSSQIASIAVEHFASRGYRNYAFCGYPGIPFSDRRLAGFESSLAKRGITGHIYSAQVDHDDTVRRERGGETEIPRIAAWLKDLPKPLAVLAANDTRGRQVLDAGEGIGLQVPEQIAVVGVDNDDVICELASPALSSVDPDAFRVGYEGAAAVHRMLRGEALKDSQIRLPPLTVVTRRSSDVLAIDDATVAKALHLIRERACDGITVEELLDELTISRATLERRFVEYLKRTPKEEITRVRMERAKQLLVETDYPAAVVADMCGYRTASHLSVVFKSVVGLPPSEYREQHRQVGTRPIVKSRFSRS